MSRRPIDERGAVAVFVAVSVTTLLSCAALAVDLGNAWARQAQVQTQVDVVALSAGARLPATGANEQDIRDEVAAYFNRNDNPVGGQTAPVTAEQLADGDPANGEVEFSREVTMPDGTTARTRMRVVAPEAVVDFGFARMLGASDTAVQATATVELRTPRPPADEVLPMWLPSGCAFGAVSGDADTHTPPNDSPDFTLANPRGTHTTGPVTPAGAVYSQAAVNLQVTVTDLPTGLTWAVVRMTFGDGKFRDYLADWPTATTAGSTSRTIAVSIGPDAATGANPVTSTAGTWQVWPMVPQDPTTARPADLVSLPAMSYPQSPGTFSVNGGGVVACAEHQRGNFGQADSPRAGVHQKQLRYAANVRYGIDHRLAVFEAAPAPECSSDDSPVGARIDATVRDGNNCLDVDPGNDPQGLTEGLLQGIGSWFPAPTGAAEDDPAKGRLTADPSSDCGRPARTLTSGSATYVVNDDTLSCFLRPGYSLADIAASGTVPRDALDAAVLESPRFFFAPVVHAPDRRLKRYLAIKEFVPVFITDESELAAVGSSDASANNGVFLNSGGKVQSLQLFAFNPGALPSRPGDGTLAYVPGTQGVPQLVD